MSSRESYTSVINRKAAAKQQLMNVAMGRERADLVLKNAVYINVFTNELSQGDIAVKNGVIAGIGHYDGVEELDMQGKIVAPGLIDAHIHLESSLVAPSEFVKAVLPHGTATVITDPHEIANVLGTDGIDYMIQATEGLPVEVRFMLPSCVPATPLDESGARLDYQAIDPFYDYDRVQGLAEMMNYTGVIQGDTEVLQKIAAAHKYHCRIDGHAPGLSGKELNAYVASGVYSDHECSSMEEALEKLSRGQYIMIREGTAARNLRALAGLLVPQYYEHCMTSIRMICCMLDIWMPLSVRQSKNIKWIRSLLLRRLPIIRPDIFIWRAEVRLCRDIRRILLCLTIFRICMWR